MTFNDGDTVIIVGGTLRGVVGKIVKTDSIPGTESVLYTASWTAGGIAYNIPTAHLEAIPEGVKSWG